MSDDFHSFSIDGETVAAHDLMVAFIAPRPIGWISTIAQDGTPNLAPYSFFTMLGYQPPLIGFSSIGWKDTVSNIQATREFVWNLATRPLADAMNATSAQVPSDVDEFTYAGLERAPSLQVAPARVALSPVAFECRMTEIIRLRDLEGRETRSHFVVGQVVAAHIRRDIMAEGGYDFAAARPILRAGGKGDYYEMGPDARFHMPRPH